jgi:cellobiose phosphorylase
VHIEQSGHYCLSFIETKGLAAQLLPIIYDTEKVFGSDTSLESPRGLYTSDIATILANPQYGWAKTSSAFAAATNITLKPGENVTIASVFGKADHIELVPQLANRVTSANFISSRFQRAKTLINELTMGVETETVNPLFDGTVKQM